MHPSSLVPTSHNHLPFPPSATIAHQSLYSPSLSLSLCETELWALFGYCKDVYVNRVLVGVAIAVEFCRNSGVT